MKSTQDICDEIAAKAIEERRKFTKAMNDECEAKKRELSNRFMMDREVFDKVWDIAWRFGHACGIAEVENYFCDMVEIVDVCMDLYKRK